MELGRQEVPKDPPTQTGPQRLFCFQAELTFLFRKTKYAHLSFSPLAFQESDYFVCDEFLLVYSKQLAWLKPLALSMSCVSASPAK